MIMTIVHRDEQVALWDTVPDAVGNEVRYREWQDPPLPQVVVAHILVLREEHRCTHGRRDAMDVVGDERRTMDQRTAMPTREAYSEEVHRQPREHAYEYPKLILGVVVEQGRGPSSASRGGCLRDRFFRFANSPSVMRRSMLSTSRLSMPDQCPRPWPSSTFAPVATLRQGGRRR